MGEEGTAVQVFAREYIEEHSSVIVVDDDCMKADIYVRGGVLLVGRSCYMWP